MKYLSWDIGIKNLSYCFLENKNNNINIIDWDIINLSNQQIFFCHCQKKKGGICGKKASLFNLSDNKYYCKTHSLLTP